MYNFKYHKPNSISESIDIFKKAEFPKYLAGGMTIIPSMKQKLSSPTDLIDLQNIEELNGIYKTEDNYIVIGSLTTHNQVSNSTLVKKHLKGLSYLASKIADNAVRNLGTIGGSICNADPSADYPAALLSLEASIHTNKRTIQSKSFFIDMFETNLENDEIVLSIAFPIKDNTYYVKISSQASKYAIIGIFGSFTNKKFSASVTGAANKVFSIEALNNLSAKELKNFNFNNLDLNELGINSDIHASSDYRIALIKTMLPKLINCMFPNE